MQAGPGWLTGVNSAEHQNQNTLLGFCRLVAYSTGAALGTEFPMKRRVETQEYSPCGALQYKVMANTIIQLVGRATLK